MSSSNGNCNGNDGNGNDSSNSSNKRITISLTRENLKTISLALRFTTGCLDSESIHLLGQITAVRTTIDNKLEEEETDK
jgi:hypothetical protein